MLNVLKRTEIFTYSTQLSLHNLIMSIFNILLKIVNVTFNYYGTINVFFRAS